MVIRVAIIYWLPPPCQELHTLGVMFSHYTDEDVEIYRGQESSRALWLISARDVAKTYIGLTLACSSSTWDY